LYNHIYMDPNEVLISITFSTVSADTGLVVLVAEVVVVGLSELSSFLQATTVVNTIPKPIKSNRFIVFNFNEDSKNTKKAS
jgi:hypothetical protein